LLLSSHLLILFKIKEDTMALLTVANSMGHVVIEIVKDKPDEKEYAEHAQGMLNGRVFTPVVIEGPLAHPPAHDTVQARADKGSCIIAAVVVGIVFVVLISVENNP
jgi:hypothetical protein